MKLTRTRGLAALLATGALVVGSLVAVAAPAYADDPVVGGQQASPADSLYPNQGNSGYDVSHYDISMKLDVALAATSGGLATTTLSDGVATITASTTGAPLSTFSFDFQGSTSTLAAATLNVSSVTVDGVPATFSRIENTSTSSALVDNHKLVITPATPVSGTFTTVVNYAGIPVRHTDPDAAVEGWNATVDGGTFVNQPVGAMTLFPVNNTPRDKATWKFTFNAPTKLGTSATAAASNPGIKDAAVASNGELTSKTVSGDGSRTTWVWEQTKPMAAELSLVSIGRYNVYESDITLASGRTIKDWTFLDAGMSVANVTSALQLRAQTKALLDFYESKYGPYPGNSTGSVVDITTGINYALETQDRPFYPGSISAGTWYHEVMHQWFGDNVSPVDWNDIWLNEGPATVSEYQVPFESRGNTTTVTPESRAFNTDYATSATGSTGLDLWTVPVAAMTDAKQLFGTPTYTRGAMSLNVVRTAIGQANFELLMKTWQTNYGGQSRTTADFIALAQTISGKDLTALFNTWIFTGGKPATWQQRFDYGVSQPSSTLTEGGAFNLTLNNRNTGRIAEATAVVSIDISDIVDDATIGTLPSNVTRSGNILTWAIPSTAVGAAAGTAVIPFTLNAGTTGNTLSGTVTTAATMLGGTCVNCSFSAVIGQSEISPAPTPTIDITAPAYGQTLTANPGTWADGTALAYQWFVDGSPISGATSATFTPDVYSPGFVIKVQVTGTLAGSLKTVRTSANTSAVIRSVPSAGDAAITGTAQLGKPLTVEPGAGWLPGTWFTYTWAANGVTISGATGPVYTPAVGTQVGQTITATITGTKAGYGNVAKTTAATAPVVTNTFTATPNPIIVGNGRASTAQAASTAGWDDFTTFTYTWASNGTTISGATNQTYTPTTAMIGTALTVTVTSTKSGYPTVVKTSDPVTVLPLAQTLQPTPTISGTPTVWQTLTLTPGTWDTGTTRAYQWLADGSPISGATNTGYTLQPEDAGKTITATVTSTRTNYETIVKTTNSLGPVALATLIDTPTPTISGTPQVGEVIEAVAGDWDAGVTLAYQWLADGDPIGGATSASFHPAAAQVGKALSVAVTGTKAGYTTVTKTSLETYGTLAGVFDPTAVPTISGTPKVGSELTAQAGTWDTDAALSYQWLADGETIVGATESTYTPGPARLNAKISVQVTGTADGFTTVTKTSDETAAVTLGDQSSTPDPTVSGTAKVDVLLTAIPGTWDADTTLAYQWFADGEEIEDATSSEFIPGADLFGAVLHVEVTGTKPGYATVTKVSADTAEVAAGDLTVASPIISGSAPQVGVQLTAVPGDWTTGTAFAYQWYTADGEISGATQSTFTPTAAQLGAEIYAKVTGSKSGYTTVSRLTPSTSAIQAGVQTLQPTPTITGTPKFGSVLTVNIGAWDAGTTKSIQWYADGDAISGATASTYTPGADQIGSTITVIVTSTKTGYETVEKESAATAEVAALTLPSTPTPTIAGTAKVGTILSAATAQWGAGVALTFVWSADGTPIPGATAATFIPGADQLGKALTVSITGTKSGYTTVTKTSAATKKVVAGTLAATSVPKISGTFRVGETLTAIPGTWVAGTGFTYQWRSNGKALTGATGETLVITPAMINRTISVTVVGSQAGYTSVGKTSAAKKVTAGVQTLRPRPAITGTLAVGSTLSVVAETHDAGTVVTYAWYADGQKVGSGSSLTLGSKLKGKAIWVISTSKKTGYLTVTSMSLKTPKVMASVS